MTNRSSRQLLLSWIVLLALTGSSVLVVWLSSAWAGLALVLCFSMFKARFVVMDFMGLRHQPTMRRAIIGWCLILAIGAAAKTVVIAVAASG